MIRSLAITIFALCVTGATAQTLDAITLSDGIALTITRDRQTGEQALRSGDTVLQTARSIQRSTSFVRGDGEIDGVLFYVLGDEENCPAAPLVAQVVDRTLVSSGALGQPCTAYDVAVTQRRAQFINPPELHRLGEAFAYDLDAGLITYGPVGYAPQAGLGWDDVSASVSIGRDLYAYPTVHAQLVPLWGQDLFVFAQHLSERNEPAQRSELFYQTGCILTQCTFAIGLIIADPEDQSVYSAYLNEGAPDIRPPLDAWSEAAREIYEAWRAGDLR